MHSLDIPRFWDKVNKTDTCWFWTGAITGSGYGHLKHRGYELSVHRISYEMFHGDIPNGMLVCHTCDNKHCVNPAHLFLGTQKENLKDAQEKGIMPRGSKHYLARLTEDEVLMIRSLHSEGYGRRRLARMFYVGETTIRHIVDRNTWKHI